MFSNLLLLALFTGFGIGCLVAALKAALAALRLWARGLRVMGVVTPRAPADPRIGRLVRFSDHFGRDLLLDPGRYGPLCGLPRAGRSVPVVYRRDRPTDARLWHMCHLLAPSFGWFVASTVVFGTGVAVSH
ncbi:hypothetical protein [Streptomyces sp. NPDC006012]|uniref:hypothetical protein n=1 Tax=Streptomyces sp. NPDC006012 TaxID=3364739 RepID=UPI00367B4873